LITFHDGWWPYFQLAFLALFSVGVNTQHPFDPKSLSSNGQPGINMCFEVLCPRSGLSTRHL
ncbi:hypothetical protein, partial [Cryobacterium sp. Y62]|uniref:hypothetical protein n=1 Tax=Cryobacterium sp. Y62 TaxID=2048284 RepID=UPI001E44AD9D